MTRQKGQWYLTQLFKKVNEALPKTRLVIRGQGELEEYLKELVSGLGLSENCVETRFSVLHHFGKDFQV
jgi:glycosyltransferase involved in cell wall biosynthesis